MQGALILQQSESKLGEIEANDDDELLKRTDIPTLLKRQIRLLFEFFSLFVSRDDAARVPIGHVCTMLRECGYTPTIEDARDLSMWCDDASGQDRLCSFAHRAHIAS